MHRYEQGAAGRWAAVLWGALVLTLAVGGAGCGESDMRPGRPGALPDRVTVRPSQPQPSAPVPVPREDPIREEELAGLLARVERSRQELLPAPGTPRAQVEARFGEGEPVLERMGWPPGPADSRSRMYLGARPRNPPRTIHVSLLVRYDDSWHVRSTFLFDSGMVFNDLPYPQTLERRHAEARQELRRLERLQERLQRPGAEE